MTAKGIFFGLLLYVALAWVGAAYLYSGPEIIHYGLLFTAIGLIVVLSLLILIRLFGWWRQLRAKRPVRSAPAPPSPAFAPAHPDDQALAALIAEANAVLAKSPSFAGKRLSSFPSYLLVGPEASGKTSSFLASGLEPQLLAGQGTSPVTSTRLANLWLARQAVFAEIGGSIFSGDLSRWSQTLRTLRGRVAVPFWRKLWGAPEEQMDLRGVIAFCDSKDFTGASSDPQRLERSIRNWQERLRAIADEFGAFPVYLAITRCDKIPYFPDFFRRLPESETNQVLGCTLDQGTRERSSPGEVAAETEAKRLTASFRRLYHALAQRRLIHLAHEPNPAQRPAVYEFPREFKRIRSPLVQFLTDVFRPSALGPGPVLRGYYLIGVREQEAVVADPAATIIEFGPSASMEATRLFRGDATQILQPESALKSPGSAARLVPRWLFVTDLFHRIVLLDQFARPARKVADRFEGKRRVAFGAACALCVLLCSGFGVSWVRNRGLLSDVQTAAGSRIERQGAALSLADLDSLEKLRVQIVRLEGRLPWSFHLGLYSGDGILQPARTAYFRRFERALLIDLNRSMTADLAALPDNPDSSAPYDPVYRVLKTHLIITSGSCAVDSGLVSRTLKEYRARIAPGATSDWRALADRQIDFYARELTAGNPVRLPEDMEARDHARQYLQKVKGIDRLYASLLAGAEKQVSNANRLRDLAPNYAQVLSGPDEISTAFSKDGWAYFEKASKGTNPAILGEACVVGETGGLVSAWQQNAETEHALTRLFISDYIDHWRKFVEGFSVLKYSGPQDAARKLEILADHKSPLLGLLAMTANQTNFPLPNPAADANVVQKGVRKLLGSFSKSEAQAKEAEAKAKTAAGIPEETGETPSSPADIARFFQPVHWVEPPGSETWVGEKSAAYIDALSQLRHSMQDIAQGARNPDPAVYQAASQNYDKAMDTVRQIAKGFRPVGVGGLDMTVETLLEEPIRLTNPFIIHDIEKVGAQKVNGELRSFCSVERNTFRKYPFQSAAPDDVTLEELSAMLQPASGALWKFQQQSLGDFVIRDGSQWKAKDPSKKPQVTPELLAFLNRAQAVTDVFYAGGAAQPQLTYTLRPKLDASFKDTVLELEIDGKSYPWTSSLQKQFTWPAPPGTPNPGAIARLRTTGPSFPFASRPGIWGIFRILGDAEPRELGAKLVEWKYGSGGVGRRELIQPAPVQLEIVRFPGDQDVFNPRFWAGLRCPSVAVQ